MRERLGNNANLPFWVGASLQPPANDSPWSESGSGAGRLGLPGDFVGLTCLTSRSTSARFVPYAVCSHARLGSKSGEHEVAPAHPLGLLRVQNGYAVSVPRWIQPSEEGVEIARWQRGRAASPMWAMTFRLAMPTCGAMTKMSGTLRTCRPPTEPWW